MIVQLGLLLITYVGSKVFDSLKNEPTGTKRPAGQPESKVAPALLPEKQANAIENGLTLADKPEPESAPSEPTGPTKQELEAQQLRYLKGSVASMAFFAARHFIPGAMPLGIATYLYSAIPYMKNVERSLVRDKRVNVDVLFFVADVLTFGTKHYFTAALGLTMIHHGRYMVQKARDDSAKLVSHLYRELPRTVWKSVDGIEVEIPLEAVREGDIIVVTSGTVIPVDGTVQTGVALVDQRALTGEGQPAEKAVNDPVFANTIVITGQLSIRVDRSGAHTTSAQIATLLLNSVSFKSNLQLKGERWADRMALPMLGTGMALLPFMGPVSTAVFINSHIGARILLFAPLTTLRHISEASTMGVLVKDGRALEQLSEVDTILFDKTGTLTTDQPEVKYVTAREGNTPTEILAYAATAERKLSHPIAKAILKRAEEDGIVPHEIQDSNYKMGFGVSVTVEGRVIRVGSVRFFREEGFNIPKDVVRIQEEAHAVGNTLVLVGVDQTIGGSLELQPTIRPEAREIISQLRAFGIEHMGIVSGDERAPTQRLAEELGMDEFFHNVLPENKADIVEALQAQGKVVCFIGDGINDTIALKKANVSMSIAGATSIAKDMADIIFMDGSLKHLPPLLEVSERLEINLQRCLVLCLVPSAVNLMGAFVFKYSILTALLVNNGFAAVGVSKIFYTKKKTVPKAALPAKSPDTDVRRRPPLLQISFADAPSLRTQLN